MGKSKSRSLIVWILLLAAIVSILYILQGYMRLASLSSALLGVGSLLIFLGAIASVYYFASVGGPAFLEKRREAAEDAQWRKRNTTPNLGFCGGLNVEPEKNIGLLRVMKIMAYSALIINLYAGVQLLASWHFSQGKNFEGSVLLGLAMIGNYLNIRVVKWTLSYLFPDSSVAVWLTVILLEIFLVVIGANMHRNITFGVMWAGVCAFMFACHCYRNWQNEAKMKPALQLWCLERKLEPRTRRPEPSMAPR